MNRIVLVGLAFLFIPFNAFAQEGWRITSFVSDIEIEGDGGVVVEETISVDFGSLQKHGIFRDLPVVYQGDNGERTYTEISRVEVAQDGVSAEVLLEDNGSNMRIRIGDPDTTISGEHEYILQYRVLGVLQSFEGFDELNWNVTGNDWGVPIDSAEASLYVPAPLIQAACFQGAYGSTGFCDSLQQLDQRVLASAQGLQAGEGLTIAVGYEAGIVPIVQIDPPPSPADVIAKPLTLFSAIAIFLGVSGFLLRRWWKYGRDRYWQRAHLPGESSNSAEGVREKILPLGYARSVSVEYDSPDNLRPAEIGVLIDERADTLDVSATIVDLAARGFLSITEEEKKWIFGKADYTFTRTKQDGDELLKYEQLLLESLFADGNSVSMSALKNSFYTDLEAIKKELYAEVARKKFFSKRPDKARSSAALLMPAFAVLGIALIVIGFVLYANNESVRTFAQVMIGAGGGLCASSVLALFFAPIMPRKTALGRELYERSRGYELFVSGTEKYRARWMEDAGLFESVLPYAIMFGVTDQLANAFKEMGIEPPQPSWYHGATAFNAANFATSVNGFSQALSSAMASRPGSSGSGGGSGGFSGGGFGGGGGGSW